MSYYGLISGLPQLKPLQPLPSNMDEVKNTFAQYLLPEHQQIFDFYCHKIDLINFNFAIQNIEIWLPGGNFSKDQIEKWIRTGVIDSIFFPDIDFLNPNQTKALPLILFNHWQQFYNNLMQISPESLKPLFGFEITLKNFFKTLNQKSIDNLGNQNFLTGGYYHADQYLKVMPSDIQLEYPFLAKILNSFEVKEMAVREQKILETKWLFYDFNCFFNNFGIEAVFGWVLKYFDLILWNLNNYQAGEARIKAFNQKVLQTTNEFL